MSTAQEAVTAKPQRHVEWGGAIPFIAVHLLALGSFWTGVTRGAVICCIVLYVVRMFGVTAGYHRYFSHRAFRTSRVFQFLLAFLAQTSAQRGVLWWAAHHRHHHRYSDMPNDGHSMAQDGFFYSHVGWIFERDNQDTQTKYIPDLMRFPELRFLNKYYYLPPILLGTAVFFTLGTPGLFFGFFFSTVLLWHGTFTINSITHAIGRRRFPTTDNSRNSWLLAIITLGEGWHNNHHHYCVSVRQGFYWYEYDITYYILKMLSWVGIVWKLQPVPLHVLEEGRARGSKSAPLPTLTMRPTAGATATE